MKILDRYISASLLLLVIAACLLWSRITLGTLDSDMLYQQALAHDLIDLGGKWYDWKFSPAPDYFPNSLLYLLTYKLLPSVFTRLFFISALQVFMLMAVSIYLAKSIYPQISKFAISIIIALVAFFTFVTENEVIWIYFHTTNSHIASLLFAILNLAITLRFLSRPSLKLGVIFFVIGVLASVSTKIYYLTFLFPLAFLLLLSIAAPSRRLTRFGGTTKAAITLFCVNALTYAASTVLAKTLTHNDALARRTSFTLKAELNSLLFFTSTLKNSFSFESVARLIFSIITLICIVYVLKKFVRNELFSDTLGQHKNLSNKTPLNTFLFATSFLIIAVIIDFLGSIISGGFVDLQGFRYFAGPFAGFIICAIAIADHQKVFLNHRITLFFWAACIALLGGYAGYLYQIRDAKSPTPPLIACLADIQKQGFRLDSGTADYWYARGISNYLPDRNWIVATDHDMSPLFWMSSLGPIKRPEHYGYHYNFVIVRDPGKPIYFDYTAETIGKLLPEPAKKYYCAASHATVWLYTDDALDVALKRAFARYLYSLGDGSVYETWGNESPGIVGSISGSTRTAVEGKDKPGILTYGPYLHLKRNTLYRVEVDYSAEDDDGSGFVDMLATVDGDTGSRLGYERLHPGAQSKAVFDIDTANRDIRNFEVRSNFSGHGQLTVMRTVITRR